jgi:hypothetical protein
MSLTYNGLLEIIDMAYSIVSADEHTLPEVYKEQAKMIVYTAEAMLDRMEAHDDAAVEDAGRTASGFEVVQ